MENPPTQAEESAQSDVVQYCRQHLPAHMRPAQVRGDSARWECVGMKGSVAPLQWMLALQKIQVGVL